MGWIVSSASKVDPKPGVSKKMTLGTRGSLDSMRSSVDKLVGRELAAKVEMWAVGEGWD